MDIKPSSSIGGASSFATQQIAKQAADWFAKTQGGNLSADERQQFQVWLASDPDHYKAYQQLEHFWLDQRFQSVLSEIPLSALPQSSSFNLRRRGVIISALAASILLLAVILQTQLACLSADYCSGVGETRRIMLADGSTVTLSSNTAINVSLQSQVRQVQLIQGEAFFEVRRNPDQPFMVNSSYSQTKVLGTSFIVRKNPDSDTVTVIHGVVSVIQLSGQSDVLKVNDQITVGTENSKIIAHVSGANCSAWTKGYLVFDNSSLEYVSQLKKLKVSGRFSISDTGKALDSLGQTLPIRIYRITPWLVVIA
jgi:transmembrane sensor